MKTRGHLFKIAGILILAVALLIPSMVQAKEQVAIKNWLPNWPI
jgi:hypothetical protein